MDLKIDIWYFVFYIKLEIWHFYILTKLTWQWPFKKSDTCYADNVKNCLWIKSCVWQCNNATCWYHKGWYQLYKIEKVSTTVTIWEILWNTQAFRFVILPTWDMKTPQKCFRQSLLYSQLVLKLYLLSLSNIKR